MNKLEVGMYVRNKYGIAKIINVENNGICDVVTFDNNICFTCDSKTHKELINKPLRNILPIGKNIDINKLNMSKNIIDLIEVGDYVNGKQVIKKWEEPFGEFAGEIFIKLDGEDSVPTIRTIKSIVTKEQFESMEYKVGDSNERDN